jgi:hypothetical protein
MQGRKDLFWLTVLVHHGGKALQIREAHLMVRREREREGEGREGGEGEIPVLPVSSFSLLLHQGPAYGMVPPTAFLLN